MHYKVDFKTIQWESPGRGFRSKTDRQGARQLRLVEYTREMEPHWCERGHFGYVLDGTLEIAFDDELNKYAAGDGVFIPPGRAHRHMAKLLSDRVTVIFVEDV